MNAQPLVRPIACDCVNCDGKWVVVIGNHVKRTANESLARAYARRFGGE